MRCLRLMTVAVAVTVAAGCSTAGTAVTAGPTSGAITSTPTKSRVSTTAPVTTAAPTTTTPPPRAAPFTQSSTQVTGSTPRATYNVTLMQLAGGDQRVIDEFNQSARAALQDQIDTDHGTNFALSGGSTGAFHIGAKVVSGEQITSWIAVPPGAHGDSLISTITLDTATAQPITLDRVFANLDAGLQRLTQESIVQLRASRVGDGYNRDGVAPVVGNFANWTASPQGMVIHFSDYQVGAYAAGLVDITIPWSNLADVLAPGMQEILSS